MCKIKMGRLNEINVIKENSSSVLIRVYKNKITFNVNTKIPQDIRVY